MVLPRADIAGTRPTASIEPPTPVAAGVSARQETFNRLAQIMLGRQLQAEVISRFNDGTFLVRVADTPARMALPDGTTVGDTLSMTMLAHEPRPTFLLNDESGSAKATLSSAGRLIDTILQLAQRGDADTAVNAKDPVLASPAILDAEGTAPKVAEALHDSIAFSGLFYESHLQEWVDNKRTAADLAREPQSRLQLQSNAAQPQSAAGTDATPALPGDLQTRLSELLTHSLPLSGNPAVTDADTMLQMPGRNDALAIESMRMLPAQLHTHEQREVVWRGELFPGQPMEWSISDDTPRRDSGSDEPQQWKSSVRFQLPSLGAVSAAIVMTGDRVQIQVSTASEETAAALRTHGAELAEALNAAGAPLDALLIRQDENA